MLLAELRRINGSGAGRLVAEIPLMGMHPANRREHHLRHISEAFSDAQSEGVKLYWTRDWRLIALLDEATLPSFEAALVRLRFALGADPLADKPDLAAYRRLGEEGEALIAEAEERVISGAVASDAEEENDTLDPDAPEFRFRMTGKAPRGEPLTPAVLGRIESMLMNANLSSHIRRQSVCVVVQNGAPNPMFTEVFVSIADLRETLLPTVDLASNPWLFQRLTQTLDRRVLALLTHRDDATLVKGFSINLNVASILSDEFLAFDDNMAAGSHGTVVVELRPEDIFADLGAYTFARDFIRQRGYRVLLDGVTWRSLPYVDARRLGAEMLKLSWTPDLPAALEGPRGPELKAAIKALPSGRLILARCDGPEAVDFGREHGITLFQGRVIDRWLRGEQP